MEMPMIILIRGCSIIRGNKIFRGSSNSVANITSTIEMEQP